jgi:hypothetical protein
VLKYAAVCSSIRAAIECWASHFSKPGMISSTAFEFGFEMIPAVLISVMRHRRA